MSVGEDISFTNIKDSVKHVVLIKKVFIFKNVNHSLAVLNLALTVLSILMEEDGWEGPDPILSKVSDYISNDQDDRCKHEGTKITCAWITWCQ